MGVALQSKRSPIYYDSHPETAVTMELASARIIHTISHLSEAEYQSRQVRGPARRASRSGCRGIAAPCPGPAGGLTRQLAMPQGRAEGLPLKAVLGGEADAAVIRLLGWLGRCSWETDATRQDLGRDSA